MQTYFDNAATSYPKPDVVLEAIVSYQKMCGASPGRGAYSQAVDSTHILDSCRELLCKLVNAPSQKHCIFTLNCTDALNLAINGISSYHIDKDNPVHIITTAMDHNSVLRPLRELSTRGVDHTIIEADPETGIVSPYSIREAIRPSTRLIAVAHGSNVTGTIQDIKTIGNFCGDIPFLVDAAQTMGHVHIDVQDMNIDLLAFPGHKGLLGPLGTGGLIMNPSMEKIVEPLRTGGTGSESELPVQPSALPDKYEPGSHNMVGIAGLAASTKWILNTGVDCLHEKEMELCQQFIEEISTIDGVSIVGPQTTTNRCGVFSLVFDECPHEIAKKLEEEAGICSRSGLHCAPYAHKTMGTDTLLGTLRISFGPFITPEDITVLTRAITNCTQRSLV
ncbi:MAG: aminotransferase class V-fold PLP-dependent enzyme [Phycisphaerales bacterium]|jgi:cysteine desulfurase family protein|nr:aminotransferase class V-fold PLP-dependent enzyme [Phycisphaerales bacterium]